MPSPRACTHVKINGVKCGSPALKYHTHCYFHYKWLNRRSNPYHFDRKEGWTTMTLPPLESKASILFAICEIQESLLTGSIDFKMAKALFYGIQLAIQLKATAEDFAAPETPDTCYELTEELEKARWTHRRPPQVVCDSCERTDACLNAQNCHHTTEQIRELERIHEPERHARHLADEKRNEEERARLESSRPQPSAQPSASLEGSRPQPCHTEPEKDGASAPEVRPSMHDSRSTIHGSSIHGSSHDSSSKLFRSPAQFARLESRALNEINILRSNS